MKGLEIDRVEDNDLNSEFGEQVPENKTVELQELEDDDLESVRSMDIAYQPNFAGPCAPSWMDQGGHDERLAAQLHLLCWQPNMLETEVRSSRLRFVQRAKWREQSEVTDFSPDPDMSRRSTQASLLPWQ